MVENKGSSSSSTVWHFCPLTVDQPLPLRRTPRLGLEYVVPTKSGTNTRGPLKTMHERWVGCSLTYNLYVCRFYTPSLTTTHDLLHHNHPLLYQWWVKYFYLMFFQDHHNIIIYNIYYIIIFCLFYILIESPTSLQVINVKTIERHPYYVYHVYCNNGVKRKYVYLYRTSLR